METNMDIDTLNIISKEARREQLEMNQKANQILKMSNVQRKQQAWNNLYPKTDLAVYGLTQEELEECNNTVY